MELSIRRWGPGQLLASWATYWVGLAGAALGPSIPVLWRATHLPQGHGTISATFDDNLLSLTVIEEGVKTYAATASFGTAMAWIIGPPLALWLIWLAVRRRPAADVEAHSLRSSGNDRLAAGSAPATEWRVRHDERVPVERERVNTPNP
jgi:Na+/glutamate symporter